MTENRYASLFTEDEYLVSRRRGTPADHSEFLTRDDRYTDMDGYPVRVTSGVSVGFTPDGYLQLIVWDGRVLSPRGAIDLVMGTESDDPRMSLSRTMRAVEGEPDGHGPTVSAAQAAGNVATLLGRALWQASDAGRPS